MKKKRTPMVLFAMLAGDRGALSRLGRYGAVKKKEIAAEDRERRMRRHLESAREISEQANEHIVPLDD